MYDFKKLRNKKRREAIIKVLSEHGECDAHQLSYQMNKMMPDYCFMESGGVSVFIRVHCKDIVEWHKKNKTTKNNVFKLKEGILHEQTNSIKNQEI